ncbi:MAG: MATE family efflux transporter, partial [Lachnospiraceae bacterium]|nr:MATE family efflux transporter [Lachnospiraceae bacterium]
MNSNSDFTQGSIFKKMVLFMVPILGALILQAMYGAVDTLVVGRFGTTEGLSGVSTGSNVINLVTFTIAGLSTGLTILIGRYLGERRQEKIGKAIGGAIVLFTAISLVLMVVLLIFAPFFATLMQAPAEALDDTVLYIRICGGGIFFIIAYNLISGIFRGMGDS